MSIIDSFITRQIDAQEQTLGVPLEYLRHIAATSRSAFFKFAFLTPMAHHRTAVSVAAQAVAHILASRHADCGTCLQISVNLAQKAGVPVTVIQAVLDDEPADLTEALADVYAFVKNVLEEGGSDDELRERVHHRYGDEGMVDLAFAVATAQMYPTAAATTAMASRRRQVRLGRWGGGEGWSRGDWSGPLPDGRNPLVKLRRQCTCDKLN